MMRIPKGLFFAFISLIRRHTLFTLQFHCPERFVLDRVLAVRYDENLPMGGLDALERTTSLLGALLVFC